MRKEARYIINEFIFDTDNNSRVINASGRLQSFSGIRNARNQMGRHLKNGAAVEYTAKPMYMNPMSRRPDMFIVRYKINNAVEERIIKND